MQKQPASRQAAARPWLEQPPALGCFLFFCGRPCSPALAVLLMLLMLLMRGSL